jgi:hypothetical protein
MEKREAIYACVWGLDVHKKSVVACRRRLTSSSGVVQEVRTFGTTTLQLLALVEWRKAWAVTHVAMKSTGVYGKPVWNIVEGHAELLLVNARHVKRCQGGKRTSRIVSGLPSCCSRGCCAAVLCRQSRCGSGGTSRGSVCR